MNPDGLGNYEVTTEMKPKLFPKLLSAIGGAIPYVGSTIQSLFNYSAQKKSNERNLAQQKELAKYRYDMDRQMYQDALEYNTPAAQMKRFRDAGLNPNLIYSRGESGAAPAVMPKYPEMSADMSLPSPVSVPKLNAWYDKSLMENQLKQSNAQTKLMQYETMLKEMEFDTKSLYLFDEAYNRATQAGYKKTKAEFDQEVMETFRNVYKGSQVDKWMQEGSKLSGYQADVKRKQIDNDIAQKNLDFLNMGLPWMLPLNMFLSTILKIR